MSSPGRTTEATAHTPRARCAAALLAVFAAFGLAACGPPSVRMMPASKPAQPTQAPVNNPPLAPAPTVTAPPSTTPVAPAPFAAAPVAPAPVAKPAPTIEPLRTGTPTAANQTPVGDVIRQHGFVPNQVGYLVFDLDRDRRLAAHRERELFIPASVSKIPTTLAALEVLGPDHRFETALSMTGQIRDGVLRGDLYLVGGGDPLFDAAHLLSFVNALEARGVRRVEGRFQYDSSYLTSALNIEPTQPEDARYNPGIGALSLGFNRIRLDWRRAKGTGAVKVAAITHSDHLKVPIRSVAFSNAKSERIPWQEFFYASSGERRWLLSPRLPGRGRAWLPVKKAGEHAASVFRTLARRNGISVPRPRPGVAPAGAEAVYVHRSPPLSLVVRKVLKFSNNLSAELIGLAASRKLRGQPQSLQESSRTLGDWLRTRVPSAPWNGYTLANHSGLSSDSRASPAQISELLRYGRDRDYRGESLLDLLPDSGGEDGIRKRRLPPGSAPVHVWAKSGTMHYGRGLAGYLLTPDAQRLGFVLFISDFRERRAYDANRYKRSPAEAQRAKEWLRRAKTLEWALLSRWSHGGTTPDQPAALTCSAPGGGAQHRTC